MADEDKAVFTVKDIYLEVRELVIEVRRLTQHYDVSKAVNDDHEKRIRSLEVWRYGLPAAIITAVASIAITLLKG
jgi:hypothetical protein